MRYALELRALPAVSAGSCAPCAGDREGRAECAVVAVIYCVQHGRCVMDAGGRGG